MNDQVPIVFTIDRRDDTGYGMVVSKELGSPDVLLRKVDPYEDQLIRLDFRKLLGMLNQLNVAERKEKNNRVLLGIKE